MCETTTTEWFILWVPIYKEKVGFIKSSLPSLGGGEESETKKVLEAFKQNMTT